MRQITPRKWIKTESSADLGSEPNRQSVRLLEVGPEFSSVLYAIRKFKYSIIGLGVLFGLVGVGLSLIAQPKYLSFTVIRLEPARKNVASLEDGYSISTQEKEHFQTQLSLFTSRTVLEGVARKLGDQIEKNQISSRFSLSKLVQSPGKAEIGPDEAFDAVISDLRSGITIEPIRQSQLVKINAISSDPNLAASIANEVFAEYLRFDRDSKQAQTREASEKLSAQIEELREKLVASEQALQAYRERRGLVDLGGSAQNVAGKQLEAVSDQLISARTKRSELEAAYQEVQKLSNSLGSVPAVVRDPGVIEAQKRLDEAVRRVAELSVQLGPAHVNLINARAEQRKLQELLSARQKAVAGAIRSEYTAAKRNEKTQEALLSNAKASVRDINRGEFELASLQREVETNKQLYDLFISRTKETSLAGDVYLIPARVVDEARPSRVPVQPKKAQIVLACALVGIAIGSFVALVRGKLDKSIRTLDDAEARLKLDVLATLPRLGERNLQIRARAVLEAPESGYAESIRTARTGLRLAYPQAGKKIFLVTSSLAEEGKTTFAINLALALAQTQKTILIEADLRNPCLSSYLSLRQDGKGLTNLLSDYSDVKKCLHRVEGSQLLVLPAGDAAVNPLELISSEALRSAIQALAERFDTVVIDSPPVGQVSDALVLSQLCTATIFVVRAGATPLPVARRALSRLISGGVDIVGSILNHAEEAEFLYYGARSYLEHSRKANSLTDSKG